MGELKASVSLRLPSVIRNPRGPALAVEAKRWGERKPGPLGRGWCRVASVQQVRSPRTVGLEKLAESGSHAGTG